MEADLDGQPLVVVEGYRAMSPVFTAYMAEYSWFDYGYGFDIMHGGWFDDCVSDGYWMMLAPLSAGQHLLHFAGSTTGTPFDLDVIVHLTVK